MTKKPKHCGNVVPSISERNATLGAIPSNTDKLKMKSDEPQRGHAIGGKAASEHGHKAFNPKG